MQVTVLEQNARAVRRPRRRGVEALRRQRDRARLGRADLIADHQLVLAAGVRQPRDLGAVGRPDRAAIVRAGTLRQIAEVALLGRDGDDLAARAESGARASRRQRRLADLSGDFLEVRPRPRQIARHLDVQPPRLAGRDVEQVHVAGLLVDDRVGPRRRAHDVEVVVLRERRDLLRIEAVDEQIGRPAPIRQEVHRVADPHRLRVVAVGPRQLLDGEVGEIEQPHRVHAAAAIVTPLARLALRPAGGEHRDRNLFVGDASRVGRVRAGVRARHRQHVGDPARARHGPQAEERVRAGRRQRVAARREHDAAAVRTPAARHVDAGMIRQPRRLAARCRHHVDVGVAAHGRRKRDLLAVGRELRIGVGLGRRGETPGLTATPRDDPEVAGVLERDLIAAHRRPAQQSRALGRRRGRDRHRERGDDRANDRRPSRGRVRTRCGRRSAPVADRSRYSACRTTPRRDCRPDY